MEIYIFIFSLIAFVLVYLLGVWHGTHLYNKRLENVLYPKMTHTLPVTADISTAHDERIETPDARRSKIKFVGADRRKRSKL